MMGRRLLVALALPALLAGPRALAYEAATTHPGLTTQAMLGSRLHLFLRRDLQLSLGVFSRLVLDPGATSPRDHRHLLRTLRRLDPAGGYQPDDQGGQRGAGWLLAGSVLGGMPASVERHHFYCPSLRTGLDNSHPTIGTALRLFATLEGADSARQLLTGTGFDLSGLSAVQWIAAEDNPLGAHAFYRNLASAVSESTPRRRDHHLAVALLAMGGVLHLLQDMASPSHVRNDYTVAHMEKLGTSLFDRGSSYERLVAAHFGQFGVPAMSEPAPSRERLAYFFSSPAWTGLADGTAAAYFSPGTLPPPLPLVAGADARELRDRLQGKLSLSQPSLGAIDLACARRRTCYMGGRRAPRLAYRVDANGVLRFFLDQRCHATAARKLLPRAVAYSAGLIDFLLRGQVSLERQGEQLVVNNLGAPFASGRVRLFAEDSKGLRALLRELPLGSTGRDARLAALEVKPPSSAVALVALVEGKDPAGEQVIATSRLSLAAASRPAGRIETTFSTPATRPATRPAPPPAEPKVKLPKPRRPKKRLPKIDPIPGKLPGKEIRE